MPNEIVKMNNKMNTVGLNGFKAVEMDIFFSFCSQAKEKGLDEITFSFQQLKELSNYTSTANKNFIKDLIKTNEKLQKINVNFWNNGVYRSFVLFPTFEVDTNNLTLKIGVHKDFQFLLNNLENNFTRFELQEFVQLESKYSKSLYRLLKQWKSVGKKGYPILELRKLLDIPTWYQMTHIDAKVLKPISAELPNYLKGFKVNKIKQGRGSKVIALEFTWQAETKESRKKVPKKTFRQETLPYWATAETPPKPTLISLGDYSKLAEQMIRLGQSIEPYALIEERYQTELKEWLRTWAKQD